MAEMPSSSIWAMPFVNAMNAAVGSAFHRFLNSSAVMPETVAKSVRDCPPVSAASSILISALENALPPIWASMPTEDSAVATPMTCASVMPTCLPAPAMRIAISMMGASVVA